MSSRPKRKLLAQQRLREPTIPDGSKQVIFDVGEICVFLYQDKSNFFHFDKLRTQFQLHEEALKCAGIESIRYVTDSDQFLQQYLTVAENNLEKILSKYSLYEMLYWTSRIVTSEAVGSNEMTALLTKDVLKNAILKHSQLSTSSIVDRKEGSLQQLRGILPGSLGDLRLENLDVPERVFETIADCCRAEFISYLFVHCTQQYRCLHKGGTLAPHPLFGFDTRLPKDISFLVNLYDSRHKYSDGFAWLGEYSSSQTVLGSPTVILHCVQNINHSTAFPKGKFGKIDVKGMSPNFVPQLVPIHGLLGWLRIFEQDFRNGYGFSLEEFVSFLCALSWNGILRLDSSLMSMTQLLRQGYSVTGNIDFVAPRASVFMADFHEDVFGVRIRDPEGVFRRIAETVTLKDEDRKDISLWTRGPRKAIFPISKGHSLIDYTGLLLCLHSSVRFLSRLDNTPGFERSKRFEEQVRIAVETKIGRDKLWVTSATVVSESGPNAARQPDKKEIDVSFVLGQVLVIAECKAVNVSTAFDRGDPRALQFRREKNQEALEQVDEKAAFVAKYANDLRPVLPKEVRYILPLVVSPFSEYIWERTENLFVTEEIPRVCTPAELLQLTRIVMRKSSRKKIIAKCYIRTIDQ